MRRLVAVGAVLATTLAAAGVGTAAPAGAATVGAPTGLRLTAGNQHVSVAFTPPVLPAGTTARNYEASFTSSAGARWSSWIPARPDDAASPVRFGGLPNGVTLHLRLRVVTNTGRGAPSVMSAPFTPRAIAPAATTTTTRPPVTTTTTRPRVTTTTRPPVTTTTTRPPVTTTTTRPPVTTTTTPVAAGPGVEIVVSPTGNDAAAGTRAAPLRTLGAAWNRIPRDVTLTKPHTIVLLAGDYAASTMPHYWELRRGTASAPITIRSDGPGRPVTLRGDLNLFEVHHLRVQGLRILPNGDAVHCERCTFLTLDDVELDGGTGAWETLKVNQSSDVTVRNSTLRNAGDNVIDFVAVQRATIADNVITGGGDWCAYVKGGSTAITIERNEVSRCGTGGITAGQGTGLEWMVEPWVTYEATDVVIRANHVFDVEGAAFGVNGGRNIVIEDNRAERVGRRSHLLEVTFGGRSCDGNSTRCAALIGRGAWGTSTVGGDVYAHIPDRDVVIRNNVIVNPAGYRSQWQHFEISEPRTNTGARVGPSPARTDDGLVITGNRIVNGDASMPLGIDGTTVCATTNPTCTIAQIYRDNDINGR